MVRILFIIAAIVVVFLIIKNRIASRSGKQQQRPGDVDDMVQCRQCRVRIPSREAVTSGEHYFCCNEHQRDWQDRQQQNRD